MGLALPGGEGSRAEQGVCEHTPHFILILFVMPQTSRAAKIPFPFCSLTFLAPQKTNCNALRAETVLCCCASWQSAASSVSRDRFLVTPRSQTSSVSCFLSTFLFSFLFSVLHQTRNYLTYLQTLKHQMEKREGFPLKRKEGNSNTDSNTAPEHFLHFWDSQ